MKGLEHDWKNNQHIAYMQQKPAFYSKKHIWQTSMKSKVLVLD